MRYLFVANQEPLQGYTEFCNNTYLALFCETRRNGYNGFPNEYEKKEQLCLIGEKASFSQSKVLDGRGVSLDQGNTVTVSTESKFSPDHFSQREIVHSPVQKAHTLIVWDRTNLAQILNWLEYSPRVVVLSELLGILTNNYIDSFEYNLCIHNVSQRRQYLNSFTQMQDYTKVLTHEIELPETTTISEISRAVPNNYLQHRVQNGIVCTFSPEISDRLQDLVKDPKMLNKFFTSNSFYFLQDLKSLYFMSKLHITTFLWENCSKYIMLQKPEEIIHLPENSNALSTSGDSTLQSKTEDDSHARGESRLSSDHVSALAQELSTHGEIPDGSYMVYRSIITLFDGYTFSEECQKRLTKVYNSKSEFNYNERVVKNFCDRYDYAVTAYANGNFSIETNISEWLLDVRVNASNVTSLFHKNIYEGGGFKNKGKRLKMFRNGFHEQNVGYKDLIYILNYIHLHDKAKEEEKREMLKQVQKVLVL